MGNTHYLAQGQNYNFGGKIRNESFPAVYSYLFHEFTDIWNGTNNVIIAPLYTLTV